MQNSSSFFQGQARFSNGFFGVYHSPFGVELKGRNLKKNNAKNYRFGFQGCEADDQVKGDGNSYTTYFRQLDSRLGRWLSIDPIVHHDFSPYNSFDNNPILKTDPNGGTAGDYFDEKTGAKIGTDGVDDGLEHKINKDAFKMVVENTGTENADKLKQALDTYKHSTVNLHEYSKPYSNAPPPFKVKPAKPSLVEVASLPKPKEKPLFETLIDLPQTPALVENTESLLGEMASAIGNSNVLKTSNAYKLTTTPVNVLVGTVQVSTKFLNVAKTTFTCTGYGLGIYGGVSNYGQWSRGEISTNQMACDQFFNAVGTFGGFKGAVIGFSYNMGKAYGPSTWYGTNDYKYFE
jgi:RHS repeat-associated protein